VSEKFQLFGILSDICLHLVKVEEWEGIAVLQEIMPLVGVGYYIIMQYKAGV
jgi:hypothetical protein